MHLRSRKGGREGTKHIDHPWHLYTVPKNPVICPVPVYANYLMCHPHILNGECKIFHCLSQYEQMNAVLKDLFIQLNTMMNSAIWFFGQNILEHTQFTRVLSHMEHV